MVHEAETETSPPVTRSRARRFTLKPIVLMLVLATAGFVMTGCNDPYYGRGRAHTGVYASYGTPGPYYRHDPYGYGYRSPYGYGSRRGYVGPRFRTGSAAISVRTGSRGGYYARSPRRGFRSGYRAGTVRRGSGYVRRSGSQARRGGRGVGQRRGSARSRRIRAEVQPE
jgi:hypothetical protein